EPQSLDVAIMTFRSNASPDIEVDLVSAVHVGEASYYADLNRRFRDYDAVLYELIAPEGTRVDPDAEGPSSLVSMLQGGMTTLLELQFQLDAIDYNRRNMVHADMTPKEFERSMQTRGESMSQMIMKMWAQSLAKQSNAESTAQEIQLLAALLSRDRAGQLKRALAEQFVNMEEMMSLYTGSDGSTLVTERNKKALSVLKQQLRRGKQRIAIFYGAGHMSDFAERLENEFDMRRVKTEWIVAWRLNANR
ncbi:MAG: hypothetical protein AAGF97_01840, partial [Planctomycetota bacterium]